MQDTSHSGLALTPQERAAIAKVTTLTEFDDLITAKHNGWRDAAEYYAVNSSAQFLPHITVPTLVVHALDDPMIPASSYHAIDWAGLEATTPVRRAITRNGGHVGFHERGADLPWYVGRAIAHLDCRVSPSVPRASCQRASVERDSSRGVGLQWSGSATERVGRRERVDRRSIVVVLHIRH